jgi:competence protein ComEA
MRTLVLLFGISLLVVPMLAQLPEGPGREETLRMCRTCHEVARSISPRQDRDAWIGTMNKMVAFGMKATDEEYKLVLDYLAKYYPAEDLPKVNVNQDPAIQLESILALKRSEARLLINYREQNGPFRSLEDLKKVQGIEFAKLEAKKDRILFQ